MKQRALCSLPLVIIAVLLTLSNDFYLKYSSIRGVATGKISDFCGLFFFPFLVFDLFSLFFSVQKPKILFGGICLITALQFAALKTFVAVRDLFVDFYTQILGKQAAIVIDPTDLIAIISLPGAYLYFHKKRLTQLAVLWGIAMSPVKADTMSMYMGYPLADTHPAFAGFQENIGGSAKTFTGYSPWLRYDWNQYIVGLAYAKLTAKRNYAKSSVQLTHEVAALEISKQIFGTTVDSISFFMNIGLFMRLFERIKIESATGAHTYKNIANRSFVPFHLDLGASYAINSELKASLAYNYSSAPRALYFGVTYEL